MMGCCGSKSGPLRVRREPAALQPAPKLPLGVLPECRWRGAELTPGRFACSSPKLVVGRRGVPGDICRRCYCANHEPPKPTIHLVAPPADLSVGPVNPTRPNVVATLAVGPAGRDMLAISGPFMRRYAESVGADFHVIQVDDSPYPLGEKFRLGTLFDHWERVLFLDADVILGRGCPDLFGVVPADRVGVHDDLPDVEALAGKDWLAAEYVELAGSQGWEIPPDFTGCLNTGVVVASREHRGMWAPPDRLYPAFHTGEQNVVNWRLRGFPVFSLPTELNYQLWSHPEFAGPAQIYHFAKPPDMSHERRLSLMRAWARRQR